MIEVFGDLWDYKADATVITTNGFIKSDGKAVMGRGCAKEAAEKWPWFPESLGLRLLRYGNTVQSFITEELRVIITFPVKHNWNEKADLELIKKSAEDLVIEVGLWDYDEVVLPRPGCGNGGLNWESEVKPIIEPILNDHRYRVITNG